MKAFALKRYSKSNGVAEVDVALPQLRAGDVLVQVCAASVNPLDLKIRNGELKSLLPYKLPLILGNDLAGVVVQTGPNAQRFKHGDEVYAKASEDRMGTFAEYSALSESDVALKPERLTMEEASSLPLVALAAWQALVDRAGMRAGQKVLIHAGSGGLGTAAIQLAKHLGATVATTTSTKNIDWVKDLGADIVIDYKTQEFGAVLGDYDVVLDTQGGDTLEKSLLVVNAAGKSSRWPAHPNPHLPETSESIGF